jgi:hypothetical protein
MCGLSSLLTCYWTLETLISGVCCEVLICGIIEVFVACPRSKICLRESKYSEVCLRSCLRRSTSVRMRCLSAFHLPQTRCCATTALVSVRITANLVSIGICAVCQMARRAVQRHRSCAVRKVSVRPGIVCSKLQRFARKPIKTGA